jgi:hypothetical protein
MEDAKFFIRSTEAVELIVQQQEQQQQKLSSL